MTSLFGISKVSEGYDKEEKDIPIEIEAKKVLEWLVTRKQVPQNWKETGQRLELKLENLKKDLPHEISFDRDINYFDIEDIMKKLVAGKHETEEKNFFGQYSSPVMKEWYNLKSAYEKNNIYLGQAAQILVQNILYDIPSIKKTIEAYEKQVRELKQKNVNLKENVENYQRKYERECSNLKIKGVDLQKEIQELVSELPEYFKDAEKYAKLDIVGNAIKFYKSWMSFIFQSDEKEDKMNVNLEIIEYIHTYGNETVHKKTKRDSDPNYNGEEDNEDNKPKNEVVKEEEKATIDWGGISLESSNNDSQTSGDIQWDAGNSAAPISWDTNPSSDGINWDITIENEGDVKLEVSEPSLTISNDNETILENSAMRKKFMLELLELQTFLTQRIAEISERPANFINLNPMSGADPIVLKNDNESTMKQFLEPMQKMLEILQSQRVVRLLEIKSSQKYVERLVQSLQLLLDRKAVSENNASDCSAKTEKVMASIMEHVPKLEAATQYTKSLRDKVQERISKLYSGRKVIIFGAIDK